MRIVFLGVMLLAFAGCRDVDARFRMETVEEMPPNAVVWQSTGLRFRILNGRGNPFDPDDFDVQLHVTTPSGQQRQHPAFFMTNHKIVLSHNREAVRDTGNALWEVRWTPTEIGLFEWTLTAINQTQSVSMSGQMECHAGGRSGFVRVSRQDPNWFETSDGAFFYPIGHVTRSPEDARWKPLAVQHPEFAVLPAENQSGREPRHGVLKTARYETWFRQMRANGENVCSVWMSPWSLGLEWSATRPGYAGTGQYNQRHAAQLDRIFDLAEEYDIRILLFTMNHGRLSTVIDREWWEHPYRRIDRQGFADSPVEYFTSNECLRLEQNRLRYILARWGSSTALFGLVLCTEANWVDPYHGREADAAATLVDGVAEPMRSIAKQPELVVQRFRELARFVKAMDVHQHPVSIQFALLEAGTEAWQLPEFDIVMNNVYSNALQGTVIERHLGHAPSGVADGLLGCSRYFDSLLTRAADASLEQLKKPKLVTEWGGHHLHNAKMQLSAQLHCGIWGMSMTNLSGVTGFWWVEHLHEANLYSHFSALAKFWRGFDRRGQNLIAEPAVVSVATAPSAHNPLPVTRNTVGTRVRLRSRAAIMLSNSTRAFAYVYPELMNSGDVFAATQDSRLFPLQRHCSLTLPDRMASGRYRVEFWNPYTGRITEVSSLRVLDDEPSARRLVLPPFRTDLAIKVRLERD